MIEQSGQDPQKRPRGLSYSALASAAKGLFANAARSATEFVYPAACPGCGDPVAAHGGLCANCWGDISFISGPACGACGAPLIAELGEGALCDSCVTAPPAWSEGAAAVIYEGAGRRLVLALKHADRLDLAPLAGGWMARAGGDLIADADLIAPAPLHWRRRMKRRFNQAAELARETACAAGRENALALDLLVRSRVTASQDGKNRAERHRNVADAFHPARRWAARLRGARVLLVDDVMTTGATLSACAEACRAAGAANVNVLVMARVARKDWAA